MKPLKFELVNGFGVLVDEEAEIKEADKFIHPDKTIERASRNLDGRGLSKIIFAEKELGLDVPVFEWKKKDVVQKNLEKICSWDTYRDHPLGRYAQEALDAHKSNPTKYTEDDLMKAIAFGREQGNYYEFATQSDSSKEYIEGLQKDQEEQVEVFIQSLQKHPKYVAMESEFVDSGNHGSGEIFHNNRTEEFILFTNSEGKQQGTVKELMWE
jgi:hypothetical protein